MRTIDKYFVVRARSVWGALCGAIMDVQLEKRWYVLFYERNRKRLWEDCVPIRTRKCRQHRFNKIALFGTPCAFLERNIFEIARFSTGTL